MYHFFIKQYVQALTKDDIIRFAKEQRVTLTTSEVNLFYQNVKQHWETVLYGNPTALFQSMKQDLRPETYEKMLELYTFFKKKYENYL